MSCAILAIKFNENKVYKNTFYAKVGGFDVDDLNNLEYNIFSRLDFNLRVYDKDFFEVVLNIYKDTFEEV